jgi:hypothetical protein
MKNPDHCVTTGTFAVRLGSDRKLCPYGCYVGIYGGSRPTPIVLFWYDEGYRHTTLAMPVN